MLEWAMYNTSDEIMKKIIIFGIVALILVSCVSALTTSQRIQLEKMLRMSGDDPEKFQDIVRIIDEYNIDLDSNPNLKEKIKRKADQLGFDLYIEKQPLLKIPEMPKLSINVKYVSFVGAFILISVIVLVYITKIKKKRVSGKKKKKKR